MGTRVLITVPKRPTFGDAYYALQRRFDSGSHEIEVTPAQLAELQGDPVITVVELTDEQKPTKKASSAASKPVAEPATESPSAPSEDPKPDAASVSAEKPAPKGPGRRKATT